MNVTLFLRQRSSVPQHLLSDESSQSFLRHKTFHFKLVLQPLVPFPRNSSLLSFNPPASCLFFLYLSILQDLNPFQHFALLFDVHLFRFAAIHQFRSHIPNTFCAISELLPCLPIILARSWPNVVCQASWSAPTCFRTPLCSTIHFFFSTKTHFSFGLGLSSSQSFHCSTRQWKVAAYSLLHIHLLFPAAQLLLLLLP